MKYEQQQFIDQTIRVDGNSYRECTFTRCVMEVGGAAPFQIEGGVLIDCEWTFADAAGNIMVMLTQLYKDPDNRPWIDRLFEQIRSGGLRKRTDPGVVGPSGMNA